MPRLVPAARQLMAQVHDLHPKATIEILDEVDGLGFQRNIRIAGEPGKRVAAALEAMDDSRIADIVRSNKGVRIRFVDSTRADFAHPFPLAEVLAVLED